MIRSDGNKAQPPLPVTASRHNRPEMSKRRKHRGGPQKLRRPGLGQTGNPRWRRAERSWQKTCSRRHSNPKRRSTEWWVPTAWFWWVLYSRLPHAAQPSQKPADEAGYHGDLRPRETTYVNIGGRAHRSLPGLRKSGLGSCYKADAIGSPIIPAEKLFSNSPWT